jgi:hypothetical protein
VTSDGETRPTPGRGRSLPVFHCPYCGEEDLLPDGEGWHCTACLRSFTVQLTGTGVNRP